MTEETALLRNAILTPEAEFPRNVYADWLEEKGREEEATLMREGKILVDDTTHAAVRQLSFCRLVPGSWSKRFIRNVNDIIGTQGNFETAIKPITLKQMHWVWRMVWQFRRQLGRKHFLLQRCLTLGMHFGREDKRFRDVIEVEKRLLPLFD